MIKKDHLSLFSAEQLIEIFVTFYVEEYGTKQGREIAEKVYYSPKVLKLIDRLREERLSPGLDGFINTVNSIPYFLFSKGETLCTGTLLAIQKWLNDSRNDSYTLSDETIHTIVVETIYKANKTKMNLNGPTFFDKYFKRLEEMINHSI